MATSTFLVTLVGVALCLLKFPMVPLAHKAYPEEEKQSIGTLAGDVQNWAILIQNYILQVSKGVISIKIIINIMD